MASDPVGTLILLALHFGSYIYSRRVRCVCNQHSLSAQLFLALIHEKQMRCVSANRFGGDDEAGTNEMSLVSEREATPADA